MMMERVKKNKHTLIRDVLERGDRILWDQSTHNARLRHRLPWMHSCANQIAKALAQYDTPVLWEDPVGIPWDFCPYENSRAGGIIRVWTGMDMIGVTRSHSPREHNLTFYYGDRLVLPVGTLTSYTDCLRLLYSHCALIPSKDTWQPVEAWGIRLPKETIIRQWESEGLEIYPDNLCQMYLSLEGLGNRETFLLDLDWEEDLLLTAPSLYPRPGCTFQRLPPNWEQCVELLTAARTLGVQDAEVVLHRGRFFPQKE